MTTVFVGDVHVGNHKRCGGTTTAGINERCKAILDALRAAYAYADHEAGRFVSLGDLFDTSCPTPQEIAAVAEILNHAEHPYAWMPYNYLLLGNHEMVSHQANDNALSPFKHMGDTTVVEDAVCAMHQTDPALVLIPFQPGDAREWFPKEVERFGDRADQPAILCFHLGIADDDTPPYLRNAHDAVPLSLVQELCVKYGYKGAIAGNWHSRKVWDRKDGSPWVMQIGTLAPTGWDNPGLEGYGSVVLVDEKGDYTIKEVAGPRFIDAGDYTGQMVQEAAAQGKKLFLRKKTSPNAMQEATSKAQVFKDKGWIADFVVQVDKAYTETEAKMAADAAKSADTLDASLSGFVENMHLADMVDREEVLALAARYLAAAGS